MFGHYQCLFTDGFFISGIAWSLQTLPDNGVLLDVFGGLGIFVSSLIHDEVVSTQANQKIICCQNQENLKVQAFDMSSIRRRY